MCWEYLTAEDTAVCLNPIGLLRQDGRHVWLQRWRRSNFRSDKPFRLYDAVARFLSRYYDKDLVFLNIGEISTHISGSRSASAYVHIGFRRAWQQPVIASCPDIDRIVSKLAIIEQ